MVLAEEWAGALAEVSAGGKDMADIFKIGQRTTIIAALTTVLFAVAKAIIGFLAGSIVLIADALHSGADSFSSFAAWFGLKIAKKEPTEKFPYGYYKAESIAAFLISGLILFAGFIVIKESISKIFTEYQLNIPVIAIGIAFLDAVVMFLIGSYEVRIGKKINVQSLIADGKESKLHLLSSSVVLIGLISAWFGTPYLEGISGILISLFIFQIGIKSIKDSIFALMDVSPSQEIENKIRKVLKSISGLRGFENLKLRKSGPFIFGEVQVKIGKTVNVKRAYEISKNIENEVKKKVKSIDSFTVAVLPEQTQKQKICIPIDEDKGLDSQVSEHFGRAKNFLFLETDNSQIKNYYTKKNPYKEKEIRAGLNSALFVTKEKVDSVMTREIGPISFHALRDNIVDIYKVADVNIEQIIKDFPDKLRSFKNPTREKI